MVLQLCNNVVPFRLPSWTPSNGASGRSVKSSNSSRQNLAALTSRKETNPFSLRAQIQLCTTLSFERTKAELHTYKISPPPKTTDLHFVCHVYAPFFAHWLIAHSSAHVLQSHYHTWTFGQKAQIVQSSTHILCTFETPARFVLTATQSPPL